MSANKKTTIAYAICFALIGIYILARIFLISTVTVSGPSMQPTFVTGNILVCTRVYNSESLKTGDIVVFVHDGKMLIKRIAATPGEIPTLSTGIELHKKMNDNEYFMLGDNEGNSNDSRNFGPVKGSDIRYRYAGLHLHPVLWYGGIAIIATAMFLTVFIFDSKVKKEEKKDDTEKSWS